MTYRDEPTPKPVTCPRCKGTDQVAANEHEPTWMPWFCLRCALAFLGSATEWMRYRAAEIALDAERPKDTDDVIASARAALDAATEDPR